SLSEEARKNAGAAAMDARIAEARALFSPSEAQVLRDGSRVIIRLKEVKFPVGKATLDEENLPLFAKVDEALKLFQGSSVVFEGNMDSTGPESINMPLSQKRADTVREYLVSNGATDSDKVTAVGKGSSRPLTANKTSAGRAMNRRVDVVIQSGAPTG